MIKTESTTSTKGFKIILTTASETTKLGGLGICDDCNEVAFKGVLVCVLAEYVCNDCFNKWHRKATYYAEDAEFEKGKEKFYLEKLNG